MSQEMIMLVIFIPILMLVATIGYILPIYLKKDILFGVRLSDKDYQIVGGDQIKQQYRLSYLILTLVFVIIAVRLLYLFPQENIGGALVGFQILLLYTILVVYNRKVLSMKNNLQLIEEKYEEWIAIDTETRAKPRMISILWFLPSLFLLMTFLTIYFVIKSSKQQLNVQNPGKSKIQNMLFRKRWMLFFMIFTPLMIIYNIFLSLSYLLIIDITGVVFLIVSVVFPLLIIIVTLVVAIYTGQSGSRINVGIKEKRTKTIAVDYNKYWKLGLIYYN